MKSLYIYITLFISLIACSSQEITTSTQNNQTSEPEVISSAFSFVFDSGRELSDKTIKDSGMSHFLYFFTPTWGHCISELQKIVSKSDELSNTKFVAISIDPSMKESEFQKFRDKNNLSELDMLPYNKEMILFFEISMRGSKRILNQNSNLIYSGNMSDYEFDLWKELLNEQ